jgi:predicted ATPase
VVPLASLNVITGPNGSGKSSLYRALRLLGDTAQGNVVSSLAREGGLMSTLWAGPETISRSMRQGNHAVQGTRRKKPVNLRLGFASDNFSYLIDLGLPEPAKTAFSLDPQIKQELVWHGVSLRPSVVLVKRTGPLVRVRGDDDGWRAVTDNLAAFDSVMTQLSDLSTTPEILLLRESIRAWRFYDHFRTDVESPARQPQLGTLTPILANDGADLAAAIQTIIEIGDSRALKAAVDDAFPGSWLRVDGQSGRFDLTMQQTGVLRPLKSAELSDGTLRYVLWIAALLTPRPPEVMVLNEPETSLHPSLLPALGRLILQAATRSQMIVVTHAATLIDQLKEDGLCRFIALEKSFGETVIAGQRLVDTPNWHWPER